MYYGLDFATVVWVDGSETNEDLFGGKATAWTKTAVHGIRELHGYARFCLMNASRLDCDRFGGGDVIARAIRSSFGWNDCVFMEEFDDDLIVKLGFLDLIAR